MIPGAVTRLVVGPLLCVCSAAGWAAEAPQRVELTTADGVELVARYQPGQLGNKSPAVLILDGVGANRHPEACDAIADEMRKQGCATLCFDFRGHGESTTVAEAFWDDPTNRKLVRGYKAKALPDRITVADFKPGYLRTLVNDVAAARAFMERRNDVSECNTGHLMIVGLREGASVGAMWVGTEWSRFRLTGGLNPRLAANPEGRSVLGCVWVEPELELDRQKVPMLDCIKRAVGKRTCYVGLIHATHDTTLVKLGRQCADAVNKKNGRVFQATAVEVGKGGGVSTHESVATHVGGVFAQMQKVLEPPPWDDRNFVDKRYAWQLPGGGVVLAKEEDEHVMKLIPVDKLIGR